MVVVLALMAYCCNNNRAVVDDLEERDVARVAKCDDQLAQERACPDFPTGERSPLQCVDAPSNRIQSLLGDVKVSIAREFAFDHEVEQSVQVCSGLMRELGAKRHE